LKRELEAEFDTAAFSSFTAKSKEADSESAVDTKEFEVDIATAAYLTEDVPCGFPAPDGKSVEVIGVRFRQAGKIYFFAPGNEKFRIGEAAIVDTARGAEYGEVVMLNRRIAEKDVIQPLRTVLRRATKEDRERYEFNREKEAEALKICAEKVAHHKLEMHLIEAQYTFDNSKLLFYFTSEGRVDFRELVRDLAGVFRTRIELRQIGIRDESRLIGGLGMCGRPFCCATFLSDFGQVSVKMAKEQGLSINTSKISGCCGRLMCCLRYEHETYAAEAELTPHKDTRVETPDGVGTVVESTPLAGTVKVRLDKAPEEAPVTFHRDHVKVLAGAGKCPKAPDLATEAPTEDAIEDSGKEN
jgi:cell fate regulator YaaT (PSP1 superfamily)